MLLLDAARAHVVPIQTLLSSRTLFRADLSEEHLRALTIDCLLRTMLPARYRAVQGLPFAADGELPAAGVLVVDASYALPLGERYAIETVYAWIEACATLGVDELEARLMSVARFKQLKRDTATAYDVTPVHQLRMFGARYAQLSDDKLNPLLGYVLAGDADDPAALMARLNDLIRADIVRAEHTPDAIIGAHDGWLIARMTRTGELAVPRSTFAKFGVYQAGDQLALLMYMLLNASLAQIQLRGPDLMKALAHFNRQRP
jgi:hypothetical protein